MTKINSNFFVYLWIYPYCVKLFLPLACSQQFDKYDEKCTTVDNSPLEQFSYCSKIVGSFFGC